MMPRDDQATGRRGSILRGVLVHVMREDDDDARRRDERGGGTASPIPVRVDVGDGGCAEDGTGWRDGQVEEVLL